MRRNSFWAHESHDTAANLRGHDAESTGGNDRCCRSRNGKEIDLRDVFRHHVRYCTIYETKFHQSHATTQHVEIESCRIILDQII